MLDLPLKITHWTATPSDYGGATFDTPRVLDGRWEDRVEEFTPPGGRSFTSNAVAYLSDDVAVGDWLFLGIAVEADPTTLPEARPVQAFTKIPDLRHLTYERKAYM